MMRMHDGRNRSGLKREKERSLELDTNLEIEVQSSIFFRKHGEESVPTYSNLRLRIGRTEYLEK